MKFINWIHYGNDCSKCKYCWESEEWGCGCYIKGYDFEKKPCRLIGPVKRILGFLSKQKVDNHMNHGQEEERVMKANNDGEDVFECPYLEPDEHGDICHGHICPVSNPLLCTAKYDPFGNELHQDDSGMDRETDYLS